MMERGFRHILWLICTSLCWLVNLVFRKKKSDNLTCLVGKTAIVTGGNSGIGYAISSLLASRGCKVIIADVTNAEQSKNSIIEITGNKDVRWKHLDLASFSSIRTFAKQIKEEEKKIDILINNAGIGIGITNPVTEDNLNKLMQVNFFGSFLLTHLLIDSLKAAPSARVTFTSSVTAYFSTLTLENLGQELNPPDCDVEDFYTIAYLYCNSKFCNAFAAQEFGERLRKYNIRSNSADPGAVRTELFIAGENSNNWVMKIFRILNISKTAVFLVGENNIGGAQTAFHLAASQDLEQVTGKNYFQCRQFPKHKLLRDRKFCDVLWKLTENLVKLSSEEKL